MKYEYSGPQNPDSTIDGVYHKEVDEMSEKKRT